MNHHLPALASPCKLNDTGELGTASSEHKGDRGGIHLPAVHKDSHYSRVAGKTMPPTCHAFHGADGIVRNSVPR
jgi:hypothetical protein